MMPAHEVSTVPLGHSTVIQHSTGESTPSPRDTMSSSEGEHDGSIIKDVRVMNGTDYTVLINAHMLTHLLAPLDAAVSF